MNDNFLDAQRIIRSWAKRRGIDHIISYIDPTNLSNVDLLLVNSVGTWHGDGLVVDDDNFETLNLIMMDQIQKETLLVFPLSAFNIIPTDEEMAIFESCGFKRINGTELAEFCDTDGAYTDVLLYATPDHVKTDAKYGQ